MNRVSRKNFLSRSLCGLCKFAALICVSFTFASLICAENLGLFLLDITSGFVDNPCGGVIFFCLSLCVLTLSIYWILTLLGVFEVKAAIHVGKFCFRYGSWQRVRRSRVFLLLAVSLLCALHVYRSAGKEERFDSWQGDSAIAHAMGEICGETYTNSLEAFQANYERGFRTFEVDILQTSDGIPVLTHHFEIPEVTGEEFLGTPVLGKYTALSFEDLCRLMKEYPDIWVVTDTKYSDAASAEEEFHSLLQAVTSAAAEVTLNRFVIQIYNEDMYEAIRQAYPFQSYIFTLYQRWDGNIAEFTDICRWCYSNNVRIITMWNYLFSEEMLAIAERYGIDLYVHTENDISVAKEFLERGVKGVYTDRISPLELTR